jgi:putative SOS response-associated peptidase YedK
MMRWGLVPRWAREAKIGNRLINARIETVAEKPAFRSALRYRRCLVPADGYYEWFPAEKGKIPYRVMKKSREVFAFAGLWETWTDPQGADLETFTIITTEPVPAIAWLHNRMPLILPRHLEAVWLNGPEALNPEAIKALLYRLRPEDELEYYAVSTRVNSPSNDDSSVIEAV